MTKFEKMENAIYELLKLEGVGFDSDGSFEETNWHITYYDGRGAEGMIDISLFEGDDAYEISTSKESQDWEPKNEKRIKTIRGIKNYLDRVIDTVPNKIA